MLRMRRSAKTQPIRRGAALVEMALVAPIFFMVILGIIEFGRAMMVGQLVVSAAREGARTAIVGGSSNSAVTTQVKNFLNTAGKISAANVTVTITIVPATGNPAASDVASATSKDMVTVTVKVPFNKISYLPPTFLKTASLTGQSTMRYE